MDRKLLLVATILTAVAALGSGTALADETVTGKPDLEVSLAENQFTGNERVELGVMLTNSGDIRQGGPPQYEARVKTARNLRLRMREPDANIDIKSGEVVVGSLPEGSAGPFGFTVELGNLEPGRYRIPVEMEYEYTSAVEYGVGQPEYFDFSRDVTRYVTVVIEDRPEFELANERSLNLFAGDTGELRFDLVNVGTRTAHDVRVELTSANQGLFFGGPRKPQRSTTTFVQSVGSKSERGVSVRVGADSKLTPGSYPVNVVVEYENSNGVTESSDVLHTGVQVGAERSFSLDLSSYNLRVGESDAVINGTVTNHGTSTARNAVVVLSSREGSSVTATGPEAAVGDLGPGETARVSFKASVSEDAEPGSHEFSFDVEYENANGEVRRTDDPVRKSLTIREEVDEISVVGVNTSTAAGSSGALRLRLRNTGGETLTNANAKLFVNDPLSSSDDGSFLGRVEPNETVTALFSITADSSAQPKEYAASLEVSYDDGGGETEFTDSINFGVPVEESAGGLPMTYVVLGVLVLGSAAFVYYRRRGSRE